MALGTNLVLRFSESVVKGTGDIVLKKADDGSVVETIAVTSPSVTIAGTTATIDRATTLVTGTGYYVEVAGTAFRDLSGKDFAGISGPRHGTSPPRTWLRWR